MNRGHPSRPGLNLRQYTLLNYASFSPCLLLEVFLWSVRSQLAGDAKMLPHSSGELSHICGKMAYG